MVCIADNMPWYNRYFFHMFYGTVAFILGASTVQSVKNYKNAKKKPKFKVETSFKDTIK